MLTKQIDPRQDLNFLIDDNTREVVAVTVYIIKDGKVLLMRQTKPHTVVGGYYVGVGGKTPIKTYQNESFEKTRHDVIVSSMLSGEFALEETPEELAAREVREEVGLVLSPDKLEDIGITTVRLLNSKSNELWHIKNFLYYADGTEGELKDCDEGILEFIPIEEIKNIKMLPHDKIILGEKRPGIYIESMNDDIHNLKQLRIQLKRGEENLYILVKDFDSEDYDVSGVITRRTNEIPVEYEELVKHIPEDKLREILGTLGILEKVVRKINKEDSPIDLDFYIK